MLLHKSGKAFGYVNTYQFNYFIKSKSSISEKPECIGVKDAS